MVNIYIRIYMIVMHYHGSIQKFLAGCNISKKYAEFFIVDNIIESISRYDPGTP